MTNDTAAFKAQMEAQFGSDEALGVTFVLDSGPEQALTVSEFEAMYKSLGDKMPGSQSLLPHGGSACCCTDYAVHIYLALPGRVQIFGFANEDNPTSRCAREQFHPGGHDFAVVDNRFIVDPWPRLVPCVMQEMVFDMEDPVEGAMALDVYGPRSCWQHMAGSEKYATECQQAMQRMAA